MSQLFAPGGQIIEASQQTSSEYSGLISFRIDWFNLAIQGTLKSFLQHHNSKASVLWCSAFFMVQLSHPHMTTGKTIGLSTWIFVGKVMSLFNMLSRIVIAFLPRSKCLLILRLQSLFSVILEPKNRRSITVHFFLIYLPCSDGTRCHGLTIWMLSFKSAFSHSSFTFIKRLFSSFSLTTIRVVLSEYLRLLIFLPASWFQLVLYPAWHFIMYSAIKLSKQGDNM